MLSEQFDLVSCSVVSHVPKFYLKVVISYDFKSDSRLEILLADKGPFSIYVAALPCGRHVWNHLAWFYLLIKTVA